MEADRASQEASSAGRPASQPQAALLVGGGWLSPVALCVACLLALGGAPLATSAGSHGAAATRLLCKVDPPARQPNDRPLALAGHLLAGSLARPAGRRIKRQLFALITIIKDYSSGSSGPNI